VLLHHPFGASLDPNHIFINSPLLGSPSLSYWHMTISRTLWSQSAHFPITPCYTHIHSLHTLILASLALVHMHLSHNGHFHILPVSLWSQNGLERALEWESSNVLLNDLG
jgi:hypothetical protein